jgi:hypothetical protein
MQMMFFRSIFYEVVFEQIGGKTLSQFFSFNHPLRCRELALTSFLETLLEDDYNEDSMHVYVFMHHRSGERIEILSSATFRDPGENWQALDREAQLYQHEGIKVDLVVFDSTKPIARSVIGSKDKLHLSIEGLVKVALHQNHHLFLKRGKHQGFHA